MALADILERIASDARAEADAIIAEAEEHAASIRAEALARANAQAERIVEQARREAELQADTVVASARLKARDATLAARVALVERAFDELERALLALPDEVYTDLFARRILREARGDERVCIAAADAQRLRGLEARVAELATEAGRTLELSFAGEVAPIEHGVMLIGERDTLDLSLRRLIEARRDELTVLIARELFGGEEA